MNQLSIYTDGGARGNPGPAAVGVVFEMADWRETYELCIGEATNNTAEYRAVLEAIAQISSIIARKGSISSLDFYLDSQLVVRQILGEYKVKEPSLQEYCREVLQKLKALALPYTFTHIPRAQNALADSLVNHALDHQAS